MKITRKKTERNIQVALFQQFSGSSKLMCPNIYLYNGFEADMLRITKNYYRYEYEIKCTRSDFKNEFKNKHRKHKWMAAGGTSGPNYYSFACPYGMIEKEELPEKYGLVYVDMSAHGWLSCHIVKRPSLLHKEKATTKQIESMARSLMYRAFYNH